MARSRGSEYGAYRGRLAPERDFVGMLEETIIMIIFMAFATAIRLWKLGSWSFWADEVFLVQDAQSFPSVVTVNPVMYAVVRFFIDFLGISERSARLGPCIVGILSIPLVYWCGKKIFNASVGVIASAFLVIHPWHIFWSQNARAYSLAFFLAALSAALFYLALERDRVGLVIASLFVTLLSILSYLQTILLLPVFAGYIVLLVFTAGIPKGLNGKNLIAFFGPLMLGLLLLISPSVRGYLISGWGANEWGRSPHYILFTLAYCLSVPVSVAAFVGGIHSLIYLNRGGLFLICYAVIPLLLLLAISPFLNVAGYYLFFTVPAHLLLAAFCASELARSASRGSKALSASVVLIVVVALVSQTYLYFMVENGGRPKWREAFQSVKNRSGPDDSLVVSMPRIAEYYLPGRGGGISSTNTSAMQLEDVIAKLATLESEWRWRNQRVWFVLDQPSLKVLDANHKFREWLYSNCRLVEEFPVYARVMDRTISVWQMESGGYDFPSEFDENFLF